MHKLIIGLALCCSLLGFWVMLNLAPLDRMAPPEQIALPEQQIVINWEYMQQHLKPIPEQRVSELESQVKFKPVRPKNLPDGFWLVEVDASSISIRYDYVRALLVPRGRESITVRQTSSPIYPAENRILRAPRDAQEILRLKAEDHGKPFFQENKSAFERVEISVWMELKEYCESMNPGLACWGK